MLFTHVFPDLTSQHGYLRARVSIIFDCCLFNNVIFCVFTWQTVTIVVSATIVAQSNKTVHSETLHEVMRLPVNVV